MYSIDTAAELGAVSGRQSVRTSYKNTFHPLKEVMMMNLVRVMTLGATAAFLAGCGGGGDSGASGSTATAFALKAGYQARLTTGVVDRYAVTGTCIGTATFSASAATAASFEGVAGFSVPVTVTSATNCTPATSAVTVTSYFDANYSPVGSSIPNGTYAKFLTAPPVLPASVKVGDTAVLATLTLYADSTKASVTGQRVISYVVETDTANTAIVNLISRDYNATNQLLLTGQTRYRIAADGTLTSTTIDMQYSTTSTTHLVFTKS